MTFSPVRNSQPSSSLVAGSALFLSSPASADEAALANAVGFQAPAENAPPSPTVAAEAPVADPGTRPLTDAQIEEILGGHNKYRARHGSPALEWDRLLAGDAERAMVNCQPFSSLSRVCVSLIKKIKLSERLEPPLIFFFFKIVWLTLFFIYFSHFL